MMRQVTTDWLYGTISTYGAGDLISDCLVAYGEWARFEVEFICKYLLPSQGTFIDVGAFIGTHSIPFALHIGNGGRGISFEPNSSSFSLLTANLQMAGLLNVTAYNLAACQSSGVSFSLFSDPENLGQTALHRALDDATPSKGDDDRCLGQAIDDLNLGHVDLIKADVEGMERNVLRGSIDLIKRCKPNIFLELNSLEEHAFVFELAQEFNYDLFGVRTLAFNSANYKQNQANDILGDGAELAVVLSTQSLPTIGKGPEDPLIVQPLKDLDELGVFLLSKPQYRSRLLTGTLPQYLGTTEYVFTSPASATQSRAESSSPLEDEMIQNHENSNQLTQELKQARVNSARLKEQLNQALEDSRQAHHEIANVQSLADNAIAELTETRAKLEVEKQVGLQLLTELNLIRSSRSWAVTAPYRKLASRIRGLLR